MVPPMIIHPLNNMTYRPAKIKKASQLAVMLATRSHANESVPMRNPPTVPILDPKPKPFGFLQEHGHIRSINSCLYKTSQLHAKLIPCQYFQQL